MMYYFRVYTSLHVLAWISHLQGVRKPWNIAKHLVALHIFSCLLTYHIDIAHSADRPYVQWNTVAYRVGRVWGVQTPPKYRNFDKVPKIKKILIYEMKFVVPNYSCLQNPWLGGHCPQTPILSVLNWICWTPPQKKKNSWVCHWWNSGEK
jgi:hypothetical protein